MQAAATLRDVVAMFPVPLAATGAADFTGVLRVSFTRPVDFGITGRVNARGIGYSNGRLHIQDAALRGQVSMGPNRLEAKDLQADALGAHFTGMLSLAEWRQFHLEGSLDGLTVTEAASLVTPRTLPWNGTLAGSLMIDTTLGAAALGTTGDAGHAGSRESHDLPFRGRPPLEGLVDAFYDKARVGNCRWDPPMSPRRPPVWTSAERWAAGWRSSYVPPISATCRPRCLCFRMTRRKIASEAGRRIDRQPTEPLPERWTIRASAGRWRS